MIAASPRLFDSGIATSRNQTAGVQIIGIDPDSITNDPYRKGLVDGKFLTSDDREGILIGQPLAEKMGLEVGDQFDLTANTSNGDVSEQLFTIRGIYSTQTRVFDSAIVFLPLEKAQALTRAEIHASTIFVLLKEKEQTDAVVNALQSSQYKILTWTKMNEVGIQTENMANSYINLFYRRCVGRFEASVVFYIGAKRDRGRCSVRKLCTLRRSSAPGGGCSLRTQTALRRALSLPGMRSQGSLGLHES